MEKGGQMEEEGLYTTGPVNLGATADCGAAEKISYR